MKKFIALFLLIALLFTAPFIRADQPLPSNQAFILSAQLKAVSSVLVTQWTIAPGYHLYRDQFNFKIVNSNHTQLGNIILPAGIWMQDAISGRYQVYRNHVVINVPLVNRSPNKTEIAVTYQGCADSGFCYPPTTKKITFNELGKVTIENMTMPISTTSLDTQNADQNNKAINVTQSTQSYIVKLLNHHHWFLIIVGFLGFGLLLAFTPCVLPMIPILSSIIVGQGERITTGRAFGLSLAYVLAMSVTYAIAGVLAGLFGNYIQAFWQNPWVIIAFSLVFVLLAFSLFDVIHFRLPSKWQEKITHVSNRQKSGTYVGAAVMGVLATLIVSPCVTPPLIGALSYIAQTGDAALGGFALWIMGIGMGIPLLIIATLGGKFLPKAGAWMRVIKIILGVLLLGIAMYLLSRIVPEVPLMPGIVTSQTQSHFESVHTLQDVTQALAQAKRAQKPVLLDFYADWCISCKIMDRTIFADPEVQSALNQFTLLRVDVTANNADDRAIQKYFNVIAPPTMLFFNVQGQEVVNARIVGEVSKKQFLQQLHFLSYRESRTSRLLK